MSTGEWLDHELNHFSRFRGGPPPTAQEGTVVAGPYFRNMSKKDGSLSSSDSDDGLNEDKEKEKAEEKKGPVAQEGAVVEEEAAVDATEPRVATAAEQEAEHNRNLNLGNQQEGGVPSAGTPPPVDKQTAMKTKLDDLATQLEVLKKQNRRKSEKRDKSNQQQWTPTIAAERKGLRKLADSDGQVRRPPLTNPEIAARVADVAEAKKTQPEFFRYGVEQVDASPARKEAVTPAEGSRRAPPPPPPPPPPASQASGSNVEEWQEWEWQEDWPEEQDWAQDQEYQDEEAEKKDEKSEEPRPPTGHPPAALLDPAKASARRRASLKRREASPMFPNDDAERPKKTTQVPKKGPSRSRSSRSRSRSSRSRSRSRCSIRSKKDRSRSRSGLPVGSMQYERPDTGKKPRVESQKEGTKIPLCPKMRYPNIEKTVFKVNDNDIHYLPGGKQVHEAVWPKDPQGSCFSCGAQGFYWCYDCGTFTCSTSHPCQCGNKKHTVQDKNREKRQADPLAAMHLRYEQGQWMTPIEGPKKQLTEWAEKRLEIQDLRDFLNTILSRKSIDESTNELHVLSKVATDLGQVLRTGHVRGTRFDARKAHGE